MQELLPLELWEEILFLLPPQNISRISLVCKAFKDDVWTIYRHLDFLTLACADELPPGDLAARVYSATVQKILQLTSSGSMRSLRLSPTYILTSQVTGALFSLVAQRTALTSLDLGSNCTNSLDDSAAIVNILRTLPHLQSVSIAPLRDGWKCFTQLQSLKSLTLQYQTPLNRCSVPQITNLHFKNAMMPLESDQEPFFRDCTNVTSLTFTTIQLGTFYTIRALKLMTQLKSFTITNCFIDHSALLQGLASYQFSSLESIEIRYNVRSGPITDEALTRFSTKAAQNMKQLTRLILPSVKDIKNHTMSTLSCVSNLAVLEAPACEIDGSVVDAWISSTLLDSLQRLDISRSSKLTIEMVDALLLRAQRLVEINIWLTPACKSVAEVSKLQKKYPNVLIHA
eukprot:TRINITY_DN6423_c0_g1_i1.p1 TRINITY_DN6423_c0_g1~~TRINITY_DN6423_c0_g1_i1.p1  ORF type:complete len:399 (-),score=21.90 TRINITY_DN6423_c0_g1_i1:14-1210(-)